MMVNCVASLLHRVVFIWLALSLQFLSTLAKTLPNLRIDDVSIITPTFPIVRQRQVPKFYNPPRLFFGYSSRIKHDGTREYIYPPTQPPPTVAPPRTTMRPRTVAPKIDRNPWPGWPGKNFPGIRDPAQPHVPSEGLLRGMTVPEQYRAFMTSYWTSWSNWSACSDGVRMRVRGCYRSAIVRKCIGQNKQARLCDTGEETRPWTEKSSAEQHIAEVYFPGDPFAEDRREALKQLGEPAR